MADQQPCSEEQARRQYQQRPDERQQERTQPAAEVASTVLETPAVQTKAAPGVAIDKLKVTAGRSGERNIKIEWVDVPVGGYRSARFNVTTAPGNGLEVTLEQQEYRKTLSGQGTVSTSVLPVAPVGTKGKLVARDAVTGEVAEQPWTWISLGRLGFWQMIKRLLGLG
jgi:hypothetical protein